MHTHRARFVVACLASLVVVAACSSSSKSAGGAGAPNGSAAGAKTTPTKLAFTAAGTPDLTGLNIPLATAGSHPGDEDTLGYIMEKTLESWGAKSSLNLGEAPEGADAVVAGKIDTVTSDMPSLLNLPLEIFLPSQPKTDYVFVSRTASTLADLKGKSIDVGTKTAIQLFFMPPLLKTAGLQSGDVKLDFTGSSSGSAIGTVLAEGRADAAWIHISSLDSLQKRVPNLHVLAQATDVLPNTADSFYAARPQWLSANPAIAEAIALAWIHAAKVFNNDTNTWVDMAEAYTLNADPKSAVTADHDTFKKLNLWPLSQSVFTPTVVSTNYSFWNSYHQFSGQGQRPLSQVADFGPWNAAWQVYNKKPNAF